MKIRSLVLTFLLVLSFNFTQQADAQYLDFPSNPYKTPPPYKDTYQTIVLQRGTMIKVILQHSLSSKSNNINDKVETIVSMDMQKDGITCIPKGTRIIGYISKISKPIVGKNASIQIIFNTLKIPSQKNISMLGYIWTEEGYSTLGGELTDQTHFKKVVFKIEGIGHVADLVPTGVRQMGSQTDIPAGKDLIIVLEKNIVLKVLKE